jgi:hypothetical protein
MVIRENAIYSIFSIEREREDGSGG